MARFDALSQDTGDAWDFADDYHDQIMLVWVSGFCTARLRPNHVGLGFRVLHCPSTTKSCWSG
ncbi:uncharacterized protein B0T23DRAFT_316607, partial [Neurospora hispaniola]